MTRARTAQGADEIYLFGFSRGAYTARAVAGVIGTVGIPWEIRNSEEHWEDYRKIAKLMSKQRGLKPGTPKYERLEAEIDTIQNEEKKDKRQEEAGSRTGPRTSGSNASPSSTPWDHTVFPPAWALAGCRIFSPTGRGVSAAAGSAQRWTWRSTPWPSTRCDGRSCRRSGCSRKGTRSARVRSSSRCGSPVCTATLAAGTRTSASRTWPWPG